MLGGYVPILDWVKRGNEVRAVAAVPALNGGDRDTANLPIQGDNLNALKALLQYYKCVVKCINIEAPTTRGPRG